ncbi:hypothetical protein OCU04_004123 [Sclerotinia nivalis]|nr:hypothetical protein OCU04_004123 [Sclerotinia nivalis]
MYSENAQIESHLSKRSFDSDAIIECLQGFTPKGGSRIVKCVAIHPKPEKYNRDFEGYRLERGVGPRNEGKRGISLIE